MKIAEVVCPKAIIPELASTQRDDVIAELVNALENADEFSGAKAADIVRAVIKRENEASTGIGKGVAVPHVKHKSIKKVTAAVGVSSAGIDFSSLDKQPVYSVILLLSPLESDQHLQAMETVFTQLQNDDFRNFLTQSKTVEQVQDLLNEVSQDS